VDTVRAEVPDPVTEVGVKVPVLCAGKPVTLKVTTPSNPFTGVIVTWYTVAEPRLTVRVAGNTEKVKSGAAATVTFVAAEGMPFAITKSSLAPVSIPAGTSKLVDTVVLPVATPIVL